MRWRWTGSGGNRGETTPPHGRHSHRATWQRFRSDLVARRQYYPQTHTWREVCRPPFNFGTGASLMPQSSLAILGETLLCCALKTKEFPIVSRPLTPECSISGLCASGRPSLRGQLFLSRNPGVRMPLCHSCRNSSAVFMISAKRNGSSLKMSPSATVAACRSCHHVSHGDTPGAGLPLFVGALLLVAIEFTKGNLFRNLLNDLVPDPLPK